MPRLPGRQQHRHNIQAQNVRDYFHLNLTISLLDHLMSELTSRFDDNSSQVTFEFLRLLPSSISSSQHGISKDDIKTIVQLYEDDLPSLISFDAKLDLWLHHWKAEPQLASELSTPGKAL